MHVLLYVLTALTFIVGTQLFVLADHTEQFFSWTIKVPMSAAFIGGGFWGAAVVVFWCARQRDWARGRVVVPTVAVVATMLLIATLQNLEAFHGLLGLAWIEVYAIFPPALLAIWIMQLARPGLDPRIGERLPAALRAALAVQAAAAIGAGILLYASSPALADSIWSWPLTDLTSKAIGTWLVGTGTTCAVVALLDDRGAAPGWALAQMAFGGAVLFSLVRFSGDVTFGELSVWLVIAFFVSMLASGAYTTWIAWQEDGFAPIRGVGGIPVEPRTPLGSSDLA
ncbi:MAG: hypothetical protein V7607_2821 [Solirubrobacteraceae bacterium]